MNNNTVHIKVNDRVIRFVESDDGSFNTSVWVKAGEMGEPKRIGGFEVSREQFTKALADARAKGVEVADVYA